MDMERRVLGVGVGCWVLGVGCWGERERERRGTLRERERGERREREGVMAKAGDGQLVEREILGKDE